MPYLKVIRASAGSGKTFSLAGEYLRLLFTGYDYYRHILAVTFTNKATGEMKSRIIRELDLLATNKESKQIDELIKYTGLPEAEIRKKAGDILNSLLHHYADFSVHTIDTFFQRIIRSFTRELGLQGAYNIELDTEILLTEIINQLLKNAESDKSLLAWLGEYAMALIEKGENWNLRKSIRTLGKEIFREEFKSLSPQVAMQFGNRELLKEFRNELYVELRTIEKTYRTFGTDAMELFRSHGLVVDDFSRKGSGPAGFLEKLAAGEFKDPTATARQAAIEAEKWFTKPSLQNTVLRDLAEEKLIPLMNRVISYYDQNSRRYFTLDVVLKNLFTLGILSDLSRLSYQWCNDHNAFLLPEAPLFLQQIIDGNETPFIYEKAGYWFHHFMIDEFQDTSLLQWQNFRPLISNSLSQDFDNLIVGDVKQSIYRWRNSNWTILSHGVERDFPDGNILSYPLEYNWRSAKNIIDFNNRFFADAASVLDKEYVSGTGDESYASNLIRENSISSLYRDIIQKPGKPDHLGGQIRIQFIHEDEDNDYYDIVNQKLVLLLNKLIDDGCALSDIAIITRKKREARQIADLLLHSAHKFEVISDEALRLGSSSLTTFISSLLQYILDPHDRLAPYHILSFWLNHRNGENQSEKWILPLSDSDARIRQIREILPVDYTSLVGSTRTISLSELVEKLVSIFRLNEFTGEQVYLNAFKDLINDFGQKNATDIQKFLDYWNETGKDKSIAAPAGQNAIRILTVHKAKGLEFDHVIIPYCDWDLNATKNTSILWCKTNEPPFHKLEKLPVFYTAKLKKTLFSDYYYTEYYNQYIDNLNLLYVAFTRACEGLYVFCREEGKEQVKNVSDLTARVIREKINEYGLKEAEPDLFIRQSPEEVKKQTKKMEPRKAGMFKPVTVPVTSASARIKVAYQGRLYIDPAVNQPRRPVNQGKVLHDIFMRIKTSADVVTAVTFLYMHGQINQAEREQIVEKIKFIMNDVQVMSWFSDEWNLLNEAEIILPGGISKRPDRIMIKQDRTLILDYKFGEKTEVSHRKQVGEYMNAVKKMGYPRVEGYIWYAMMGKIVQVKSGE